MALDITITKRAHFVHGLMVIEKDSTSLAIMNMECFPIQLTFMIRLFQILKKIKFLQQQSYNMTTPITKAIRKETQPKIRYSY